MSESRFVHCSLSAAIAVAVSWASFALAQEPHQEADDVARPHSVAESFRQLADALEPSLAWNATNAEEHRAWRNRMQETVVRLLGRMPDPAPLEVVWLEEEQFEKFTRRKLLVRTEDSYWAPVYLFVPQRRVEKVPAIVCLHGHSGIEPYIREARTATSRRRAADHELDYAVTFAERGYVTAAIVVRGWNETAGWQDMGVESVPRSCTNVTMNALMLGMTPQGLRCWDAMRVIDFLQSREEVDPERIGVAGLSGGGTLAIYLPILDERVKLAMIGGAFSSFRASIYSRRHCICNCLPGILQYGEMEDVAALHAPRPLLLINGVHDPIFPIAEAREGYETLQQVYALLGADANIDADFFDGPHAWSNRKTMGFLEKHFGAPGQ